MWSDLLGVLDTGSNIALTIWMFAIGKLYQKVVIFLVDMENHKYTKDHYDSMINKTIFFQCINYYGTFLYVALKLRHTEEGCPHGNCILFLRYQLAVTVSLLITVRIAYIILQTCRVKWRLAVEEHQSKSENSPATSRAYSFAHSFRSMTLGKFQSSVEGSSFLEQQSMYNKIQMEDEIEEHSALILSLGYVLLFGSIFPHLVFLAFINFAVHLRSEAFMLTHDAQRPVPEITLGIGAWLNILEVLRRLGMFMTAFMLVCESVLFKDAELVTRCSGMLLFAFVANVSWRMIDFLIPHLDESTQLLAARRRHTVTKMQYLAFSRDHHYEETETCKAVHEGVWDNFPMDKSFDDEEACTHARQPGDNRSGELEGAPNRILDLIHGDDSGLLEDASLIRDDSVSNTPSTKRESA